MGLGAFVKSLYQTREGRGVLGIHVQRATADLGATAVRLALFDVTGGEVLVTCLYCLCVTAPAAGANAVVFDATPAVGTGPSPMDDGVGDVNGLAIGDIIAPQGDITVPAVVAGPLCAGPIFSMPYIAKVGDIGITKAAAVAMNTWRCDIYYIPLQPGALVAAA